MPHRTFDLSIVPDSTGYRVRASAATTGELPAQPFLPPFVLPLQPRQRQDVVAWIQQASVQHSPDMKEIKLAQRFGELLFKHLVSGEILAAFRASRATLLQGERLRLRLRLPPELISVPWELLYDPHDAQFLVLASDLALVRYPEVPVPILPLRVEGPLQVLVVLASPNEPTYQMIHLERELRWLQSALQPEITQGSIVLDVIQGPGTFDQLRKRLLRPAHVLHILCHGELDAVNSEGVLIFEDADGAAVTINAEVLRPQIAKQRGQMQLVLLNTCLGALPGGDDPFSSLGVALLRAGVPAVIAMQFELAADAAAELTRIFYGALAAEMPVDLALIEARMHLFEHHRTRLDWVIPVLFLRSEDGILFQLSGRVAARNTNAHQARRPFETYTVQSEDGRLARHGLEALRELIKRPDVSEVVAKFRDAFQAVGTQIAQMTLYKQLHDHFQVLESSFSTIDNFLYDGEKFVEPVRWKSLNKSQPDLQTYIAALLQCATQREFEAERWSWKIQLERAQGELQVAIRLEDSTQLKHAINLIRKIINSQPSRINDRLMGAASVLSTYNLEQRLHSLRNDISRLPLNTDEQQHLADFEEGVAALGRLSELVSREIALHNNFQEVDNELRRIEGTLEQGLGELSYAWVDLRPYTQRLCNSSKAGWSERLSILTLELEQALKRQVIAELEQTLKRQVAAQIIQCFRNYRSQASRGFHQVDSNLLKLCNELAQVGDVLTKRLTRIL